MENRHGRRKKIKYPGFLPVRQTILILSHGSVPAECRGKQLCGGKLQW